MIDFDNTSPTDNETPIFKQKINPPNRFGTMKDSQTRNQQASVFDQAPMMQKYETLQNTTPQGQTDLSEVTQINSLRELLGVFGVSL